MQSVSLDCHQHMIEIQDLSFSYGEQKVISGLNYTVKERDFLGIIGSNGAGKTTLLKMIVGLLPASSGEIRLFGQPVKKFNAFNPLFPATVREVVLSGLYNNKNLIRRVSKSQQRQCEDSLEVMRIQDIADKRVGQLSGGQQQRVFLARALINHPNLLILDEPTVGIDAETQAGFFELITHMHAHHHMTFLMVSHDIDMIENYLGHEPVQCNGKINFYSRHSHEVQDCVEDNLQHTLS
jgi:zinc transport system ATP-binding protein